MNDDKIICTRSLGLTNNATVFQAEIQAIRLAYPLINERIPVNSPVTIMVDSQAFIKALENTNTKSLLVKQTKQALNNLGKNYKLKIKWIKAHVNNKGNEIADQAAKTGCGLTNKIKIPVCKSYVKNIIQETMYKEWHIRWQTENTCRQTFFFHTSIDRTRSKHLKN